jgi:hypothetical protein
MPEPTPKPALPRKSRKSFWLRQFYTIHWMSPSSPKAAAGSRRRCCR